MFEIRSLKHTVMPGVTATVLMEGNKFEMEDHRNWMDASYKTYVCSLLDPWPYTLEEGRELHPVDHADDRRQAGSEEVRKVWQHDQRRCRQAEGPDSRISAPAFQWPRRKPRWTRPISSQR